MVGVYSKDKRVGEEGKSYVALRLYVVLSLVRFVLIVRDLS